jgi:glutamyl-tRNA synthetase
MYERFGWQPPVLCHLPLLRNPDRSKLSKRKNPTSIRYYRQLGILPQALLNYLALMGWTMPDGREFFTLAQMVQQFDPSRIALGGPVFDVKKLTWLNGKVIRETMSPDQLLAALRAWRLDDEVLRQIMPLVQPRLETLSDFVPLCDYLLNGHLQVDADILTPTGRSLDETLEALVVASTVLEELDTWSAGGVEATLRRAAEAHGWELREFLVPIFGAISGRKVSLPLFDAMQVLGKDLGVVRLRDAREALGTLGRKKQDKLLQRFREAYETLAQR